ncbi:hypothetical protein [Budvicia diplopodorum]|uniref:hypothetical protein n=1 Tax=Budvicia diplopodorum TaxID=1119056 RepID=UPI001357A044|nr:hypothetical protein [Budvicia diplopodorum]
MWFLRFLFKKRFDSPFIERFFYALSERISGLEIVWKKGGSAVIKQDASSAVIKKGRRVLFVQNPRSGWIDVLFSGEDRQALIDVAKEYKLGSETPNFIPGVIGALLYFLLALSSLVAYSGTIGLVHRISVVSVTMGTILMIIAYRSRWSNNLRSLCATVWILSMIASVPGSLLLLPLVMASNRQQLASLYIQNEANTSVN